MKIKSKKSYTYHCAVGIFDDLLVEPGDEEALAWLTVRSEATIGGDALFGLTRRDALHLAAVLTAYAVASTDEEEDEATSGITW